MDMGTKFNNRISYNNNGLKLFCMMLVLDPLSNMSYGDSKKQYTKIIYFGLVFANGGE
jgi:hypothetical protein